MMTSSISGARAAAAAAAAVNIMYAACIYDRT
jgi:hypothetical protein